jgi:hypothetical protein
VKVLLNSDIAFSQRLRALPTELVPLAEACKERNFEITLPLTSVLEFERKQREIASGERSALRDSAATLRRYGIRYDDFKADELIQTRRLDDLLRDTGVKVEVVSPTIDDFNDAHRRASLHLSPQMPNKKGGERQDEMRDLVIWAISIRMAKELGGALLVSRDKIHSGEQGKEEAQASGLSVVPSVGDALKFFKIETPDAKLFIEMLTPVWKDLPGHGLTVPPEVTVLDVRNARFVHGTSGRKSALATVHVGLAEGGERAALIQLKKEADGCTTVHVFEVGEDASIAATEAAPLDVPSSPDPAYEERLARLRKVLGG